MKPRNALVAQYPLILLTILLALPARAATREPVSPFGMQLHSMEGAFGAHRAALDLCKRAGVKLIRDEIHWARVEREEGVLKIDDNIRRNVENTLKAGIEPMIILDYGNPFYDNGNAPVSREAVEGFARYCEFMARTFKGRIKYWEVWNEPNTEGFWKPRPDPKDYARLLKAAHKACKKGDLECTVIGVCTSEIAFEFIEGVLKAGGARYMDALSVHPYRYPATPEASGMVGDLGKLRELMDKRGAKRKPIWITEIGWPTHVGSKGITPEEQANMLVRAYVEAISAGVETIFWYWFGKDGPDPTYNEHHFGIRFADGSPKPAYIAYQTMTRYLEGAKYARSIWIHETVRAHVFAKGETDIAVLWCIDGVRTVSLNVGTDEVLVADGLSADGGGFKLTPANGMVTLTLTELPCYLIRQAPIEQTAVLPGNPFEFLPGRMTLPAGETNSVGVQIVNPGAGLMNGQVRILSDHVTPRVHNFSLASGKNALLVSKLDVPSSAPRNLLTIPAEVEVAGKLVAKLELLVKITPPAAVEISPGLSVPGAAPHVSVEVRNLRAKPLRGKLLVTISPSADGVPREFVLGPIQTGEVQRVSAGPAETGSPPDTIYTVTAEVVPDEGPGVAQTKRLSFLTSKRAKRPVSIDGRLDEWAEAVPIHLERREQIVIGAESWKGTEDSSGVIYTMWDDGSFYVAARVRDDVRSAEIYGERIYNNDGIEVYFDTDFEGDRGERRYSGDDFQYGCFNSPKGPVIWNWNPRGGPSPGGKIAFVYDESLGSGGFIIEARIPMSEIGLSPKAGKTIGFTVALNDDDSPAGYDPFRQDRQMNWAGNKENWLDPTQFGHITLVE